MIVFMASILALEHVRSKHCIEEVQINEACREYGTVANRCGENTPGGRNGNTPVVMTDQGPEVGGEAPSVMSKEGALSVEPCITWCMSPRVAGGDLVEGDFVEESNEICLSVRGFVHEGTEPPGNIILESILSANETSGRVVFLLFRQST